MPKGEAIAELSRCPVEVSSMDSDEVENVVRALESDIESTTIEAEEDEDPPEVIPEEEDEVGLADLYMPPGSVASVKVDDGWATVCRENKFLVKGL